MNKLTKFREIRFYQQNGRCHYCGDPMWTTDSAKFAKIYQVSNKQARWRQAKAEHLIPRSKGGSDRRVNIVEACLFCNSHRHRAQLALDADTFREKVKIGRGAGRDRVGKYG